MARLSGSHALVVIVALGLAQGCARPDSHPELKAAVADMIVLLEAGDYDGFLSQYAEPDTLKRFETDEGYLGLLDQFKAGAGKELLKRLRVVAACEPRMIADDGMRVHFENEKLMPGVTFRKVDDVWRLEE